MIKASRHFLTHKNNIRRTEQYKIIFMSNLQMIT